MATRSFGSASARASSLVLSPVLRGPVAGDARRGGAQRSIRRTQLHQRRDAGAADFWLMYFMLRAVNAATGLMATAQLAPIAKDFGIAQSDAAMALGATVLSVALVVDNVMNGLARPFFGWVSDTSRPREHDGDRLLPGRAAYCRSATVGARPMDLRVLRRADLLHLGRDFQPVPVAVHRHVRAESTPPPTRVASTRPRAPRRCWCRSPTCSKAAPADGRRCS